MADTDLILPSRREIFIGDVRENRPNSEAVNRKIAGNINYLLERVYVQESFTFPMYFNGTTNFDDGLAGTAYITNDATIDEYYMNVHYTGDADESRVNAAVYDAAGAFVNNLFGLTTSGLAISGSNGNRVTVGRKDIGNTNGLIQSGIAGHTVQYGVLNLTTLLAGYRVIPFIEGNANRARHLTFAMKLKEL